MTLIRPLRETDAIREDVDPDEPSEREVRRSLRVMDRLSLAVPNVSSVMFRQKMTHLAIQRLMEPTEDGRPDRFVIDARITFLRKKAHLPGFRGEWRIVNEIELLMIGLLDLSALRIEARRQLMEAEAISLPCVSEYAKMIEAAHDDEPVLRDTLFRLVSEMQDRHRKRHLLREFVAAYTARVSLVFGVATTLFMLLIILLAWVAQTHLAETFAKIGEMQGPILPSIGGMRAFASFYVAIAAGLFGAAFSMMASTKKRVENSTLEDMRTNARFTMLFFRLGVGIGAAMILYFVFDTGMLGDGSLTPSLRKAGFAAPDTEAAGDALFTSIGGLSPNRDLSLLMLWSFVAGFSEVLVPSILRRTEGSAGGK